MTIPLTMQIADMICGMLAPHNREQCTPAQPFVDDKPCLEKVFLGGCNLSAQGYQKFVDFLTSASRK